MKAEERRTRERAAKPEEYCDICNCLKISYFHKTACINAQVDDDNLENKRTFITIKNE